MNNDVRAFVTLTLDAFCDYLQNDQSYQEKIVVIDNIMKSLTYSTSTIPFDEFPTHLHKLLEHTDRFLK
jgi:hypothetical protein